MRDQGDHEDHEQRHVDLLGERDAQRGGELGVWLRGRRHDELMELGGLYSRLYRMNYASFDDIPEDEIARLTKAEGET